MRLCEYCSKPLSYALSASRQFCDEGCRRNYWRDRETRAKAGQIASLSQVERIERALERGPVSPTDFLLPNVIDGGKPILRLGARIYDLRRRGLNITERAAKNGTAIYELVKDSEHGSLSSAGERTDASPTEPASVPGALGVHTTSPVPLSSGTGPATSASPHADVALFSAGAYQTPAHHHYQEV